MLKATAWYCYCMIHGPGMTLPKAVTVIQRGTINTRDIKSDAIHAASPFIVCNPTLSNSNVNFGSLFEQNGCVQ